MICRCVGLYRHQDVHNGTCSEASTSRAAEVGNVSIGTNLLDVPEEHFGREGLPLQLKPK